MYNKVNLYFVPNTKNETGGQFYNLYINRGERLDLTPFLEEVDDIGDLAKKVKKEDKTFKSTGGMILKRDDEFQSVDVYSPDEEGINITPEEQSNYKILVELVRLSNWQAEQLIETQRKIQELTEILGISDEEEIENEKVKRKF